MKLVSMIKKSTLAILIATVAMFSSLPSQAGMVSTATMTQNPVTVSADTLQQQRLWIQSQLEANGVSSSDAALRVSNLSDSQILQVGQRIDELPAGASAGGVILFGLLVLVITDLTGLTDVFPFIRPAN